MSFKVALVLFIFFAEFLKFWRLWFGVVGFEREGEE